MAFSKFMDKVKSGFGNVMERYAKINIELKKLLKKNRDYISANQRLGEAGTEAVTSLKTYGSVESGGLHDAFDVVSDAMERVETNRAEFIARLEEQYIAPLVRIDDAWKKLQGKINEEEAASKDVKKATADLEKSRAKPSAKLKVGEIEQAEARLQALTTKAEAERDALVKETGTFTGLKVTSLKEALENMLHLQAEFYEVSLDIVHEASEKLAKVDVESES